MNIPTSVAPGDQLAHISSHIPGHGTFVHNGGIISSSLVGFPHIHHEPSHPLPLLSVQPTPQYQQNKKSGSRKKSKLSSSSSVIVNRLILPEVGSTVTARVVRITARYAAVEILAIVFGSDLSLSSTAPSTSASESILSSSNQPSTGVHILADPLRGTIRSRDIYDRPEQENDVYHAFRPGDIVVADVVMVSSSHVDNTDPAFPAPASHPGPTTTTANPNLTPGAPRVPVKSSPGTGYMLSTSREDRGVVFAYAKNELYLDEPSYVAPGGDDTGDIPFRYKVAMIPVDLDHMKCPLTGKLHRRKVART